MTELSYTLPEVGEPSVAADPRTLTALQNIKTWAAGQIDSTNLKAEGVESASVKKEAITEAKLAKAVVELLNSKTAGGETKKSIIATEQSRENTAFGTLATPDEIELVMPTNGLIALWYHATWGESVKGAARAAFFIGATQLKTIKTSATTPQVQETENNAEVAGQRNPLYSIVGGLRGDIQTGGWSDVTTGQTLGTSDATGEGGPCYVFAAAGSYKISVQFKASSGTVAALNRKLWGQVLA